MKRTKNNKIENCPPLKRFLDSLSDTLLNPSVIVEVLSKSTREYDHNEKFAFYRQIPSLTDYILIAQDQPTVEHFVKQPNDEWALYTVTDPNGAVTIRSIDCTLALADIYDQIAFGPE